MNEMTVSNLRSVFGGESMAHMRYLIWGQVAEQEGLPNVGRLFRAVAFAEQVHAANHFRAMADTAGDFVVASGAGFGLAGTSSNLQAAVDGELFEVNQMYPVYMQGAKFQQEKGAVLSFHYALEAEKIHARMYADAKTEVDAGKDIAIPVVQVCEKCGYTHCGDAPEKCPICKTSREAFVAFG